MVPFFFLKPWVLSVPDWTPILRRKKKEERNESASSSQSGGSASKRTEEGNVQFYWFVLLGPFLQDTV